jgi:malonate transporter and related proteins
VTGVFDGFAVIALVIGLGVVLAHLRIVDAAGQQTLSTLAFYVASPALLITVLQGSDPGAVFSGTLLASAGGVLVVGVASVAMSWARRRTLGETVVGALSAGYCNAANLGLPVATYVLGDATLVAPVMLMQIMVLQPVALTLLDVAASESRLTPWKVISRPFKNPITIGSMLGLLLAVTGARLPSWLDGSVTLVGDMSVPAMLVAYGVSLRLGPLPGRGVPAAELGWQVGLKMVGQPLATYLLAQYAFGLEGHQLLAVTVIAALPTAQNVFVMASRYGQATLLARDVIFLSTIASAPVVLLISALLS